MAAFDAFLLQHKIDLQNTIRAAVLAWMAERVDNWKGNSYDLYIEAFRNSHLSYLKQHLLHSEISMLAMIKGPKIWARLEPFSIGFAACRQHALV
jgi:hypothetical protein